MIRIFTSLYPESNPIRSREIQECLRRNLEQAAITEVCLLLEGNVTSPFQSKKLHTRKILHRPQYEDFFNWANERTQSDEDVSVICNSDICFDSYLQTLSVCLQANQCAALSRWEVDSGGVLRLFDRNDSQDVWVFRGNIRPVISDFLIGVPRCDNRMLHELRATGYEVINPAFSVRTYHLHAGERTEYPAVINGPYVQGPYEYLWPHNLMSLPATMLHRLRHPEEKLDWRIDWRKLQRTLPWRIWNKLKRRAARS